MSLFYRPEIDGLRAAAVTIVILFHAKVPGFSGGFIGVDIFFVISGFLITSIIVQQSSKDAFSYSKFVERRIRRILPALSVVTLTCIPFAYWLMLPDPLENFGQSLFATTFSANNILLWQTSGYWDLASDFKPLLHTWSLGVEEQFYIIYPLLLVAALKFSMRVQLGILTGLGVLSFVLMVRSLQTDPTAAFYLLHFRAWQLMVGGTVAILTMRGAVGQRPWLAALGVSLIVIALFAWPIIPNQMALTLLLATTGTALFLASSTSHDTVSWLFTRRPVIFSGLVSYSLYLWHQPVLSFLRVSRFDELDWKHTAFGILLTFGLAIVTWKYVEVPFRSEKRTSRQFLFGFIGLNMVLAVAIGSAMHLTGGFPHRLQSTHGEATAGTSIAYNERVRKLLPIEFIKRDLDLPRVAVVGNSFARDFSNVLIEAGLNQRLSLLYRDDILFCPDDWSENDIALISSAQAVIFASGSYKADCANEIQELIEQFKTDFWFVGPKHFGNNLNPLLRLSPHQRTNIRLEIPSHVVIQNEIQAQRLGADYIDILSLLSDDGKTIRAVDEGGDLLTTDRVHFSRAGAVFVADRLETIAHGLFNLNVDGPQKQKEY